MAAACAQPVRVTVCTGGGSSLLAMETEACEGAMLMLGSHCESVQRALQNG